MSSLLVFIKGLETGDIQSCWYFQPSFVNYCHSNLLSGSTPPPLPPSQSKSTVYTDSFWLGGGGVELGCVGDNILQEFNTLFLTRIKTYKISTQPQTKT